jgi:hypothetical protein
MRTILRLDVFHASPSFVLGWASVLTCGLLLAACSGQGAAQSGDGQGRAPTHPDAQTAAARGLESLRKLVNADNARDMGFDSVDEASVAALGAPVRVQMVRLDALRRYEPGADPAALLTDANRVIYPVSVKDQVRSSVIVEGAGSQWTATSFGGPHLVRQMARFRADVTARLQTPPASLTVVHVAALNLYFLGYRVDDQLMLTPLENHPTYRLEAGASLPAVEVFTVLAPIARAYNGLPL